MTRRMLAHLTQTLSQASSRRMLVAGTAGAVALGLNPDPGEGKRSGKRRAPKRRLRNFVASADAVIVTESSPNCNNPVGSSPELCTTTFSGNGNAKHLGKVIYTSSLTTDWSNATNGTPDGFCGPLTGTIKLRTRAKNKKRRGRLTLSVKGTACQTGSDGNSYPLILTGSYSITRGTGAYTGAKGNGRVEGAIDGAGAGEPASAFLKGKIRY